MEKLINKIRQEIGWSDLISQSVKIVQRELKNDPNNLIHSLRVGLILNKIGAQEPTISAGILHHMSIGQLDFKNIPPETKDLVAFIIKKVSQLRQLSALEKSFKPKPLKKWQKVFLSEQAENLRRMFFAVAQDIRPIFVVLSGRIDEMRHFLYDYDKQKQQKKAGAALEILAPLAYGLGIGQIKGELEDLAFPILYPKEYKWLRENSKEKYALHQKHTEKVKPELIKLLRTANLNFLRVDARAKHYFSLYQKLLRHDMDINQIYDLVALKIVLPDIASCYQAMGTIHNLWPPMYGRIKDYISSPKPNGYRSLHTTVKCPHCNDNFIEIQLKTIQMDQEAQFGAAAHLNYKKISKKQNYRHHFYWLNQLRKWQDELQEPQKIAEHLKNDLFKDRIFVFTPKKEIINLPRGATPIDFAYTVHSDIGDHCQGAKINGKMVSLKQSLKTGDAVEIITSKNKIPSSDWIRFVKTQKAKSKIRNFLEKAYGISLVRPGKVIKEKASLITKILPKKRKKTAQILIGGQTGIAIKMAKCCKPKLDDQIIAFVTKGEGASVHKMNCSNLKELEQKEPERIVQASWTKS